MSPRVLAKVQPSRIGQISEETKSTNQYAVRIFTDWVTIVNADELLNQFNAPTYARNEQWFFICVRVSNTEAILHVHRGMKENVISDI